MKNAILVLLVVVVVVVGCNTAKSSTATVSIYNTTWELEYLSGTRIAFEGLYPEVKPTLILNEKGMTYGGNSSCNTYTGSFTYENNLLQFGETTRTMRYCEGGGESAFFGMLKKISKPVIDSDGKLLLMMDDVPMMRFRKIETKK
ncbi:META domain-containing protein [Flavobacterium sp.]|jgi:heat shock protein HslJ|uniref:META domain-containing protein n=1 Tax=Flavobacterium TaxID=237 RepID=UPI000DB8167E|nr:META domain-containing protein [Flavobacterium sp.]MCZ8089867.1 META domain-containing protein [Flavobacterium sp.]PZO27704.1 MAG: META domain-containing protein [Flavobacteriaceae bacterium]